LQNLCNQCKEKDAVALHLHGILGKVSSLPQFISLIKKFYFNSRIRSKNIKTSTTCNFSIHRRFDLLPLILAVEKRI